MGYSYIFDKYLVYWQVRFRQKHSNYVNQIAGLYGCKYDGRNVQVV
jgi:hypothetical protein